jgi:hypothetical protein
MKTRLNLLLWLLVSPAVSSGQSFIRPEEHFYSIGVPVTGGE